MQDARQRPQPLIWFIGAVCDSPRMYTKNHTYPLCHQTYRSLALFSDDSQDVGDMLQVFVDQKF